MSLKDSIKQLQKREHITQDEIIRRLGCTRSSLMENPSAEAIAAFDYAFGNSPVHDSGNAVKIRKDSRESKELEKLLPWARKFPIRALQNKGLIPANAKDADLVRAVFRFMNVGSIAGFENYYSATLQATNPQTNAAWIRLGELSIERSTTEYTPDREAILSNLKFLRTNVYLHGQDLRKVAREALNNCGIKLIEVEPFLTAPTPACAFYWRGNQPVIQVPTSRMDDAKFLEAIFHAVGHLLYHPLRTMCLQTGTAKCDSATAPHPFEIKADAFAQDTLLSEAEECELICCGRFNERRCIQHFSGLFHVRPGILVARLQQQGKIKRGSPLNDFKIAV